MAIWLCGICKPGYLNVLQKCVTLSIAQLRIKTRRQKLEMASNLVRIIELYFYQDRIRT